MQYSSVSEPAIRPQAQNRPRLTSLDSSQECSLEHWLELYKLVEKEDFNLDGYVFDDSCLLISQ
jgi:hypothetical protein